jgi:hypothetical protein
MIVRNVPSVADADLHQSQKQDLSISELSSVAVDAQWRLEMEPLRVCRPEMEVTKIILAKVSSHKR